MEGGRRRPHRRHGQRRRRVRPRSSGGLRTLQTGSIRTYAASLFIGVVLILGYYLSADAADDNRFSCHCSARCWCSSPAGAAIAPSARGWCATSRSSCRWSPSPRRSTCGGASIPPRPGFQFVENRTWLPQFGISYHLGVDGISLFLIVLTGFLTPLSLLCSWESTHKNVKLFSFFLLALESAMLGVFVSIDLFLFYIFWDAVLIPMYFLIGIWGYERRIYAAVKFILYTMVGSILMLVAIIGLSYAHGAVTGHADLRHHAALRHGAVVADGEVVLPRLRARFPDQGPAVPVPHLAARRARRGADRRIGHPGRRDAEDGHLRAAAIRVPALPERVRRYFAPYIAIAGGDRHHLRRAGRHGAARHEEAGGVFLGQPPRVRRPRPVLEHGAGRRRALSTRCSTTASARAGSS